jgi:hypothetical protein
MKSIQDCHNWLRRVMRLRTASINVVELSFKAESMNLILFLYTKRCTIYRCENVRVVRYLGASIVARREIRIRCYMLHAGRGVDDAPRPARVSQRRNRCETTAGS